MDGRVKRVKETSPYAMDHPRLSLELGRRRHWALRLGCELKRALVDSSSFHFGQELPSMLYRTRARIHLRSPHHEDLIITPPPLLCDTITRTRRSRPFSNMRSRGV